MQACWPKNTQRRRERRANQIEKHWPGKITGMKIKKAGTVFYLLEPLRILRLCGEEFAAEAAPTVLSTCGENRG